MMGGGMMGGNIGGFGLAGGLIGLLFNIALIIGIIVLIIWAVQKFSSSNPGSKAASSGQSLSAREIADIRYARGELTREEYQSIRHDVLQS
jgi:putative membrane protein